MSISKRPIAEWSPFFFKKLRSRIQIMIKETKKKVKKKIIYIINHLLGSVESRGAATDDANTKRVEIERRESPRH